MLQENGTEYSHENSDITQNLWAIQLVPEYTVALKSANLQMPLSA